MSDLGENTLEWAFGICLLIGLAGVLVVVGQTVVWWISGEWIHGDISLISIMLEHRAGYAVSGITWYNDPSPALYANYLHDQWIADYVSSYSTHGTRTVVSFFLNLHILWFCPAAMFLVLGVMQLTGRLS